MAELIDDQLLTRLIEGVHSAGSDVMAVYRRGFNVVAKADDSPLTEADMAAHHALVATLEAATPEVPILSEESSAIPFETRREWDRYWLVDPLDGTKEFIGGSGEFTVNVALVEEGEPRLGIVHAPALAATWVGQAGRGAWKRDDRGFWSSIAVRPLPFPGTSPWRVVGSRRHGAAAFDAFCAALPEHERVAIGSSLKLCLVAEGAADLYPRLAPTSEWDTAAGQAVVVAAGGEVLDACTLQPLRCNRQESVLNPFFIACGQRDVRWELALAHALQALPGN